MNAFLQAARLMICVSQRQTRNPHDRIVIALGLCLLTCAVTTPASADPGYEPVTWTNPVNVTATGATVTKTAGCGSCADAHAVGTIVIGDGDASFQFSPSPGKHYMVGLVAEGQTPTPATLAYAFKFWTSGAWDVREHNVYRKEGLAAPGDVFRITLEGAAVRYYRNDQLVYTGPRIVGGTHRVAVLMYTLGSMVEAATITVAAQGQLDAPTIALAPGAYAEPQSLHLTAAEGATIRFTLDGSEPDETSPAYADALLIGVGTTTVRARAYREGWDPSEVTSATYVVSPPSTTVIALTSPVPDARLRVSAPVSLTAAVTSTVPVASVAFYANGTLLDVSTVAPHLATWTPSEVGSFALTAAATDTSGRTTMSASVAVTVVQPPVIINVSPTVGAAGAAVTITGSGFGAVQDSSVLWLGTKPGVVSSWTDTVITAMVATGSASGTAHVRGPNGGSDGVPFTVVTPTIADLSPTSGPVGGTVTITGAGFGASQGTGAVWIGSVPAVVQAWTDTQVIATVGPHAASGHTQVLQSGVLSNAIPFTVTGAAPRIDAIWPTEGGPGTEVTIYGSGFGDSQGGGLVRIAKTITSPTTWTDSQITVTVATGTITGNLKVQQHGLWSNGTTFTVPSSGATQVTLTPNELTLEVGDTREVQALDPAGLAISDLLWTSSDTAVVELSEDNPPLLEAVGPGTATIEAGGASVEVTVFPAGQIPTGAVLWSVPGTSSGVSEIQVAVPHPDGVADVFGIGWDGSVQAITPEGRVAWTAMSPIWGAYRPDYQGGLLVFDSESIYRLHPQTGQAAPLYTNANAETRNYMLATPAVHPDGTVFTVDYACHDYCGGEDPVDGAWVVGIDSTTGVERVRVPLQNWTYSYANEGCSAGGEAETSGYHSWPDNELRIAADGYVYLTYMTFHTTERANPVAAEREYQEEAYALYWDMERQIGSRDYSGALATLEALLGAVNEPSRWPGSHMRIALTNRDYLGAINLLNSWRNKFYRVCNESDRTVRKLHLMRVGTDGSSSDVVVREWTDQTETTYTLDPATNVYSALDRHSGPGDVDIRAHVITNADQGALYSWQATESCSVNGTWDNRTFIQVDPCRSEPENHLTTMREGSIVSDVVWEPGAQPRAAVEPVLQFEDGSFAGSVFKSDYTTDLIVFDTDGRIRWTRPGVYAEIAVAGGTLIASDDVGMIELSSAGDIIATTEPTYMQSWSGNTYRLGSVERIYRPSILPALSLWPQRLGNPSQSGARLPLVKVFLPLEHLVLTDTTTRTSQDYQRSFARGRSPLAELATFDIRVTGGATADNFLEGLTTPGAAVALFAHGIFAPPDSPYAGRSVGFHFPGQSLVMRHVPPIFPMGLPQPIMELAPIPTQAKLVFLASCQMTPELLALFSVTRDTRHQALITAEAIGGIPAGYGDIPLNAAAEAWRLLLEHLLGQNGPPKTLYQAISLVNNWLAVIQATDPRQLKFKLTVIGGNDGQAIRLR
jgi:hypothetical protein